MDWQVNQRLNLEADFAAFRSHENDTSSHPYPPAAKVISSLTSFARFRVLVLS